MVLDNLSSQTPGKSFEKDGEVVSFQRLLRIKHPYPGKIVAVTQGPQAGNYIFHQPSKGWLPLDVLATTPLPSSFGEIGQSAANPLVYQFWMSPNGSLWVITMSDDGNPAVEPYQV